VEDRLAKSLRAAHERHAQHLSASHDPAPHGSHTHDQAPAEHHGGEHHASAHHAPEHHKSEHHTSEHHAPEHHQATTHAATPSHHPAFQTVHSTAAEHAHTAVAPSVAAAPQVHLVAAEHHTHSTVPDQPIHASVIVPPVLPHTEHKPAAAAASTAAPSPATAEPSRLLVSAGSIVKNRFTWQGGRVSIVGTVLLSVLISSGLFSLQLISKWRRPKPTDTVAKADSIEQPLTIAQDESQVPNESADSQTTAVASKDASSAQSASHPEDSDQRGLDDFFANTKKEVGGRASVAHATTSRAPYAPDPVDVSAASGSPADTRTVMAPEAAAERGLPSSEQPAPPAGQPDPLPAVPSNPAPGAPSVVDLSAPPAYRSATPSAAQVETASMSPSTQPQVTPGMNVAQWNRSAQPAAPGAPAALPASASTDTTHSLLDAPGPVIMPGRSAGPESTATGGPSSAVVPAAATSDPSSQLRDYSQSAPSAPGAGVLPTTPGIDPVTGLVRRPAAPPELAGPEVSTALASLDRSKVMSFQFRNAPWTVVLSQFAAETHLELRMQKVPQGVFNRWDATRYSPSQTLAILNSEIARAGCQLKLDGSVLRVVDLAPSTAQNAPTHAASPSPLSLLPQSSGIVPVSGRY
jgi:hypothetical protein